MAAILVIEDDFQFLSYLKEILTDAGHEVVTADDGEQGLRLLLDEKRFDLLITDIFMPSRDGVEILRQIRKERLAIKIICISGGGQQYPSQDALNMVKYLGADLTMEKPFTKKDLLPAIDGILEK